MKDILKEIRRVSFGKKLADARKSKNLSIRKLAAKSGLSATYVSYLERGKQGPPSMEATIRLAEVLEENKDEFLAEAGHVSHEVSEAYRKNPKEMSGAVQNNFASNMGLLIGFIILAISLEKNTEESDEFPEPEEAFKQLKEQYLDEESSIVEEREYFDYCSSIMGHWKADLEIREKEQK